MDVVEALQIFAFVTGIAYIVLEILQKNAMWVLGIAMSTASACSFGIQMVWASMALNVYYVAMSVWGLWKWRKASQTLECANSKEEDGGAAVHLGRLDGRTLAWSCALFVVGTLALAYGLGRIHDPSPWLDSIVSMMSALATWWLAKSIPQQWFLWIVADVLSMSLCLVNGMHWLAALYMVYSLSAVLGWFHWTSRGRYVDA